MLGILTRSPMQNDDCQILNTLSLNPPIHQFLENMCQKQAGIVFLTTTIILSTQQDMICGEEKQNQCGKIKTVFNSETLLKGVSEPHCSYPSLFWVPVSLNKVLKQKHRIDYSYPASLIHKCFFLVVKLCKLIGIFLTSNFISNSLGGVGACIQTETRSTQLDGFK